MKQGKKKYLLARITIVYTALNLLYALVAIIISNWLKLQWVDFALIGLFLVVAVSSFYYSMNWTIRRKNKLILELNESRSSYKELYRSFNQINIQLRNNNEELKRINKKLADLDELKNSFISNMSHEIRTPLNSIIGFSELIGSDFTTHPKYKKYIQIIKLNSNQLIKIINDVLDLSKLETGLMRINKTQVHLNKFIDSMLITAHDLVGINRKNIIIQFQKGLDNGVDLVDSDPVRLNQILFNLLENAVKFTKTGKIIFGYSLTSNRKIQFFVFDTGKGISSEKFNIIFESFRQCDESKNRRYSGTGMGLPICKGLVELLGGEIWLESEPDNGSTFFFTIPYETDNQ
jgi:signal transduction histidine kinase